MEEWSVSRRLQVVSTTLLKLVVLEQALAGLWALGLNASYLSKIAGLNQTIATLTLVLVHLVEGAAVVGVSVPTLQDRGYVMAGLFLALAAAAAVETALAVAADDKMSRTTSLFLVLAGLKHAASEASSRRLRTYGGSFGNDSMADDVSEVLRHRASRYKLAPLACIGIGVLIFYTLSFCENPLSGSALTKMLGRAQYGRSCAIAAFVSAVGAEDRSRDPRFAERGVQKRL